MLKNGMHDADHWVHLPVVAVFSNRPAIVGQYAAASAIGGLLGKCPAGGSVTRHSFRNRDIRITAPPDAGRCYVTCFRRRGAYAIGHVV
jgi:hypothetical protein